MKGINVKKLKKISEDLNLISTIMPSYTTGRRRGYTDDETE